MPPAHPLQPTDRTRSDQQASLSRAKVPRLAGSFGDTNTPLSSMSRAPADSLPNLTAASDPVSPVAAAPQDVGVHAALAVPFVGGSGLHPSAGSSRWQPLQQQAQPLHTQQGWQQQQHQQQGEDRHAQKRPQGPPGPWASEMSDPYSAGNTIAWAVATAAQQEGILASSPERAALRQQTAIAQVWHADWCRFDHLLAWCMLRANRRKRVGNQQFANGDSWQHRT